MAYLLSHTFLYMLGAFLLGLLLGWIIWGRLQADLDALRVERDRLKADLDGCARARSDLERRLREAESNTLNERARMTAEIDALRTSSVQKAAPAAALMATPAPSSKAPSRKKPQPKPAAAKPVAKAEAKPVVKAAAKPVVKAAAKPTAKAAAKPVVKAAAKPTAKAGKPAKPATPDDLRLILGIGKVNEKKLHAAGVTTFAQIAAWKAGDVEKYGDLINFGERIVKEHWVEQAKLLAKGDMEAFYKAFPAARGENNT